MKTYLCPDCGVGAGAILTQNGPLPELCKQQLQNRRDSIIHGISITRLAAFIEIARWIPRPLRPGRKPTL